MIFPYIGFISIEWVVLFIGVVLFFYSVLLRHFLTTNKVRFPKFTLEMLKTKRGPVKLMPVVKRTSGFFFHLFLSTFGGAIIGIIVSVLSGQIESPNFFTTTATLGGLVVGSVYFGLYAIQRGVATQLKILKKDLDWAESFWSAFIIAGILMYTTIQAFKIPTGSMRTTFLEGDHLFVLKFFYGINLPFFKKKILAIREPKRFDIVVFTAPLQALSKDDLKKKYRKDFIKRIIGMPGDIIQIKNKTVYVNNRKLVEKYVRFADDMVYTDMWKMSNEELQKCWEKGTLKNLPMVRDNLGPIKVPEDCYFVLGDNRDQSFDSRFWGPVKKSLIKGKPIFIYWPPNRIRLIK